MVTTMPRPTNPRIAGPAQEKSGSESNFFSSLEMEDLGGELHAAVRALAAPPGRGQENGVVVWESIRASLVHNVGATRIDVYKTRIPEPACHRLWIEAMVHDAGDLAVKAAILAFEIRERHAPAGGQYGGQTGQQRRNVFDVVKGHAAEDEVERPFGHLPGEIRLARLHVGESELVSLPPN